MRRKPNRTPTTCLKQWQPDMDYLLLLIVPAMFAWLLIAKRFEPRE